MSEPTAVIQRRDLYALSKNYDLEGNREGYVGLEIMPLFNTQLESGNFPTLSVEELMKKTNVDRAPRGTYNRIDYGFGQDNYKCVEKGLEGPVDESIAANYESYFDAEVEMQGILLDQLYRAQEIRIKDIVEAESATSVTTPWSTSATCTPRVDIKTGIKAVRDRTGVKPDSLSMTWSKFQDLLVCSEFVESAKYVSNVLALGFEAQVALVRSYLGIQNLIVAEGVENTADEGLAFAGSDIWTDESAFLFIKGNAGLMDGVKYGRTMNWVADELVGTESYEEPQTRSTILRVRHHRDEKVATALAGYRLDNL